MQSKLRQRLLWLAKLGIGLVLIAWYGAHLDWQKVTDLLRAADPERLLYGALLITASTAVAVVRWRMLLKALGATIPLSTVAHMVVSAVFFNSFTPGGVAGDAVRAVQSRSLGLSAADAFSSVITDRVVGLCGLTFLSIAGLAMNWQIFSAAGLAIWTVAIVVLVGASIPLLYSRRVSRLLGRLPVAGAVRRVLGQLSASLKVYRHAPTAVAIGVGLSIVSNLLIVGSSYVLALAIGASVPLTYFLAFVPPVLVLCILPITVGGLGIREGGYVLLFPIAGMAPVQALGASLLFTFTFLAVALAGGMVTLLTRRKDHGAQEGPALK